MRSQGKREKQSRDRHYTTRCSQCARAEAKFVRGGSPGCRWSDERCGSLPSSLTSDGHKSNRMTATAPRHVGVTRTPCAISLLHRRAFHLLADFPFAQYTESIQRQEPSFLCLTSIPKIGGAATAIGSRVSVSPWATSRAQSFSRWLFAGSGRCLCPCKKMQRSTSR
jgi:hypothetical protein